MRVLLLSGDVHCGKTTLLSGWCRRAIAAGAAVEGVLAGPDDAATGLRHVSALPSMEARLLQLPNNSGDGDETTTTTVRVGAYTMVAATVAWARELVRAPLRDTARCPSCGRGPRSCECAERFVVLDEVGPLELRRGEGLEPAVSELFARVAEGSALRNAALVAVVRSPCVEEFLARYRVAPEDVRPFVGSPEWARYSEGIVPHFPFKTA